MFWQNANYEWATKYVYGIEKDYRLVKVGKVGCYLHGDGLANVILSDGLGNFVNTEDYKGILRKNNYDGSMDNQQFDIILSNPPYSVSSFRQTTRDFYTEKDFELYNYLTDNSSEIECLFVERTKQLLKDGGIAGVILPSSILTNTGIYTKTRELLLKYFEIVAITELGSNTFMATGTNTVVLFLRRKNNYDCINLQKSVDKFFTDKTDVTINNIETPVAKYVNYVWEDLTFDDYLTLLNKEPNAKVKKHDIFKEYSQKIKSKSEKEFWNKVLEIEKEKLYYFMLAYPQKIVTIKTGEKDAEKQFLGYEFSNRRGSEGIHAIQRGKSIDECTHLFDINTFDNPQKASTYIYRAFSGDTTSEIDDSLKDNISRVDLLDMMTFDRVDFEKVINVKAKKKIKIESKWNITELGNISGLVFEKGKSITKQQTQKGNIPVVAGGIDFAYLHNVANRKANVITISASGANAGFVNFWDKPIWASDCSTIQSNDEKTISIRYIYEELKALQKVVYDLQKGNAQPHVYIDDIKKIRIPLPPFDIQQKIVDEIEEIEKKNLVLEKNIQKLNTQKNVLISSATTFKQFRLGDLIILEYGKALPKYERNKGIYPVVGSNGIDGYHDSYMLEGPNIIVGRKGSVGKINLIQNNCNPIDTCYYVKIKNNNLLDFYYCYQLLLGLNLESLNVGMGPGGLNRNSAYAISVKIPPLSEQQKIVAQIEKLEKQIAEAQAIIDNSNQQKQEILDKYLK